MGYAFISYSRKNLEDALALRSLLSNRGIETWMAPGDIPVGSNYAGVITRAIREADCMVLLLTDESQNSNMVDKEVDRALTYRKPLFPIALNDLTLNDSFELYLCNQHILPVRQISHNNKALLDLVEQIARITDTPTEPAIHEEVTGQFAGQRVLIYSAAAKKFASARLDLDKAPVCCSTDRQEAWEIFHVTVDEEGWASFMACNKCYLTVSLDLNKALPPVRAAAPESLSWEKFKIYKTNRGFAIKAKCNRKWVSSRIDWENSPLLASRALPDTWELFDIRSV